MKRLLASIAFLAAVASGAIADAASRLEQVSTSVRPSACRTFATYESGSSAVCPGPEQWRLVVHDDDLRVDVEILRPGAQPGGASASGIAGDFVALAPHLGSTFRDLADAPAVWTLGRLKRGGPAMVQALTLRVVVDPGVGLRGAVRSSVVVIGVDPYGGGRTCVVAVEPDTDAGRATARRAARIAPILACKTPQ